MSTKRKIKDFNNLEKFPDLKEALVPVAKTLPEGSMNTKVIIIKGKVVERVYVTPKGEIITLFSNTTTQQAA
tara:strand:- start:2225 stop:2440 length:216 start_codon:yes stop_codon:yes gene_type:complete